MITLMMVTLVIWILVRTAQVVTQLWRLADGAGFPWIGVVTAT